MFKSSYLPCIMTGFTSYLPCIMTGFIGYLPCIMTVFASYIPCIMTGFISYLPYIMMVTLTELAEGSERLRSSILYRVTESCIVDHYSSDILLLF